MAKSGNSSTGYVLVKWADEESWDVLPVKKCLQNLNVEDGRAESKIGHVFDFYWKKGEESAPATLLAYGKQRDLEKQRDDLVISHSDGPCDGVESPTSSASLGVGHRTIKRPARLIDSDGDVEMEETDQIQKKKKKPLQSTSSKNILQALSQEQRAQEATPSTGTSEGCTRCRKYDALKAKYRALKAEHAEVMVYKDLHKVVKELQDCSDIFKRSVMSEAAPPPEPITPCTSRPSTPASLSRPPANSSRPSTPAGLTLPSPSIDNPRSEMKTAAKVDIGNGVLLEKVKLLAITQVSDNPTKLARNLFMALFKKEEVIGRSITGKKSNAHLATAVEKERLDPVRISSVIDFTLKKFPSTSASIVKQSLSNKVKEMNKKD